VFLRFWIDYIIFERANFFLVLGHQKKISCSRGRITNRFS